jgi:hypothetical protein
VPVVPPAEEGRLSEPAEVEQGALERRRLWLHVVKGRTVLGVLAFVLTVGVLPRLFWPSTWTDLGNDVAGWFR